MTAREFFKATDTLPLRYRLAWGVRDVTGFLFYKSGPYKSYFLPKDKAQTIFDVMRFVAIHNIEDYNMIGDTDIRYVTTEDIVNGLSEMYRFDVVR